MRANFQVLHRIVEVRNIRILAGVRNKFLLYFGLLTLFLLLSFQAVLAQSPVIGAAVVRGSLDRQFARHILTVSAWNSAKPLTILLEYSPQDRSELDDRSGFFVFDQVGYDRFRSGEIPGSVSIAAGDRLPGEGRRLQATIGTPVSGNFFVMVYNDSTVPMGYTLRATNGGFSDSNGQVLDAGAPAPASDGAAPVFPYVVVPGPTPTPVPAPTPIPPLRASVVRGLLDARYAQDFFTLEVVDTGLPLSVEMIYDPAEQILLLDSFNFWIFDEEQFRTQEISGARPEFEPNRAAGKLIYRDDVPVWVARIEQPLAKYMLVVNQHEHALSVGYRLTVQNGVLVDDGQQAQAVLTQPRTLPGVGNTLWIVRSGDTLGSIAQAVYGDRRYYAAICSANGLFNCSRLVPGQRLILPPVSALTLALPSSQPLLPPARPSGSGTPITNNLLEVAAADSSLQTFRDLIGQTPLADSLRGAGSFTVFAFTNAAFDELPVESQDALLLESDTSLALLSKHVASGRLSPDWVTTRTKHIVTINGGLLRLDPDGAGGFTVNGASVLAGPIEAANGVMYVIDRVVE